jgi:prepilin signal peptidase PulO-like enzyme (type II secretory pathway)
MAPTGGPRVTFDPALTVLWGLTAAAALTDLAQRKIPNLIVGPGMLIGLLFSTASGGVGLASSALGILAPFVLLAPIWRMDPRLIRAGDIKLYMCIGAFLGWKGVLLVILYGHLFKGLAALTQLGWFQVEKRRAADGAVLEAPTHTPAALPIFAGTLLQTALPHLLL